VDPYEQSTFFGMLVQIYNFSESDTFKASMRKQILLSILISLWGYVAKSDPLQEHVVG
jgi:hypothetical protein